MLIAILSPRKARFLGYFKKQKMNYARNIEIIRKHTFMITKKICILLCFQCFLCARHSFLTKVIFIQRTLKNIQGLPWKIKRTFQGYPTIFQFSRAHEKHYPLFYYILITLLPPFFLRLLTVQFDLCDNKLLVIRQVKLDSFEVRIKISNIKQ